MADGEYIALTENEAKAILSDPWPTTFTIGAEPLGGSSKARVDDAPVEGDIPQTTGDLGELTSSAYDLSATRAGELNIPVVGTVGGGTSRRVVILEWTRFKRLPQSDGRELRYGFAVRFCLTVNKWNADLKISLPFLSAQAELGNIQAAWTMEVRGLVGPKIDATVIPPQPLSVETFVTARQSMEGIVAAISDPTTRFVPGILLSKTNPLGRDAQLRKSSVEAYALYCISRGRSADRATGDLPLKAPEEADLIRGVYDLLEVPTSGEAPAQSARDAARMILNGIKADA